MMNRYLFLLLAGLLLLGIDAAVQPEPVQSLEPIDPRKLYRSREYLTLTDFNGDILFNVQMHNAIRELLPTVNSENAVVVPRGHFDRLYSLSDSGPHAGRIVVVDGVVLEATRINADTVRVNVLEGIFALTASRITSGTFGDARIPDLPADKITSGTFGDARIPDLSAIKITSDEFDLARLPAIPVAKIDATGVRSSSTSLRGDGSWSNVPSSGGGGGPSLSDIDARIASWARENNPSGTAPDARIGAATGAVSNSVAKRGTGGVLNVGPAVFDSHAANKGYVDAAVSAGGVGGGPLTAADIPDLPADKITSGTFGDARIPSGIARDSEIPDGSLFPVSGDHAEYDSGGRIQSNTPASNNDVVNLSYFNANAGGTLTAADIPDLPADKITSGTFGDARIGASTSAFSNTVARRDGGGRLVVGTPTISSHAATKAYVDAAAGGAQIYRESSLRINGDVGPGSYTWAECALVTARSVVDDDDLQRFWWVDGSSTQESATTIYYNIQSQCSDGVCNIHYEINNGVLICGD